MHSTIFTRTIHAPLLMLCVGLFAIIVSYYVIVPREWLSSDIVMKYGHTMLWMLIGALFLGRRKKFVVRHLHTIIVVLLCGYVAFLVWFSSRALSYVT